MAHGNPRYEICTICVRYTKVNRFDTDTKCDICKKRLTQTNKEELITKYGANRFNFIEPNFNRFVVLKKNK